jgi:hypothetical protein
MWERLLDNLGFSRGSAVSWHSARVVEDSTDLTRTKLVKAQEDNCNELATNHTKSIAYWH